MKRTNVLFRGGIRPVRSREKMREDEDFGVRDRQPLLDDYDGKRAGRSRYQSKLPRTPFKLATDYARTDMGLSQHMSRKFLWSRGTTCRTGGNEKLS